MSHYEIESVDGVGYLVFELEDYQRIRRIGEVFQSIQQARLHLNLADDDRVKVVYHCAYDEMINGEQGNLDLVTP